MFQTRRSINRLSISELDVHLHFGSRHPLIGPKNITLRKNDSSITARGWLSDTTPQKRDIKNIYGIVFGSLFDLEKQTLLT